MRGRRQYCGIDRYIDWQFCAAKRRLRPTMRSTQSLFKQNISARKLESAEYSCATPAWF